MTAVPASGYPSNSARTQGQMKTFEENILSILKEVIGVGPKQTLTLSASGQITPVNNCSVYGIDSFNGDPTDNADNFLATNMRDGGLYAFCGADGAHAITMRHNQGASNKFILVDGVNMLIEGVNDWIIMYYSSASSGTLTEFMRSSQVRINRIAGASEESVLNISGGVITPTNFVHELNPEGSSLDDLDTINHTTPGLAMWLIHPESVGDQINLRNNTGSSPKIFTKGGANWGLAHPNDFALLMKKGSTCEVVADFPPFPVEYIFRQGRVSLSSTLAVPGALTNQGTIYLLPHEGKNLSGYVVNCNKWVQSPITGAISVSVPNAKFCPFFVKAVLSPVSLTWSLSIVRFDGGVQVTKTITNITAANPCVVTTSTNHGLIVGDMVAIEAGTGNIFTDAKIGLSDTTDLRLHRVTAQNGTTQFTLGGVDTTGKTYTSGGTVYKVPAQSGLVAYQDGILIHDTVAKDIIVGGGITGPVAGQVSCKPDQRNFVSFLNPVTKCGADIAMSNNHNAANNTNARPMDLDLTKRKTWFNCNPNVQPLIRWRAQITNGAASVGISQVGVNTVDSSGDVSKPIWQGTNSQTHDLMGFFEPITSNDYGAFFAQLLEVTTAASNSAFVLANLQVIIPW